MGDVVKAIIEAMDAVLPDNLLGIIVGALFLSFTALVITGKFKLEWIAYAARHIFRWLRCKIRDKHYWQQEGIGWMDLRTGARSGTFVCSVCRKVLIIP